ncbi:DUF2585 family protein [Fontivita pretiosa]|uniref:DUF2585 family protein n=1 Tax=Fontivita pretiosa TaxID=2989684 RepID=UPI003D185102
MTAQCPDAAAPTPLRSRPVAIVVGSLLLAVVYLRWQGRVWWCACGGLSPVSITVWSPHNSQHLLDAYSLSHVLHGVIFFGGLWLLRRWLSLNIRAALAAGIEIGWEVLENSPIIINRYRAATISLGYSGDSIVNSLGDVASFVLGFYVARKLGLWWSLGLILGIELVMLWLMRDNLTLNVLMLLWPIDAIRRWQSGG